MIKKDVFMLKKIIKYYYLFLFCFYSAYSRIPVKHRSLFYTEEKVYGRVFSHRIELLEGRQKDLWKVDGQEVDDQTYEELILEAEKEERRQERKREYEERLANHMFRQQAHEALVKKLLRIQADTIAGELKQLGDYRLDSYFVYSSSTIINRDDYDYLAYELLPQVDQFLSDDGLVEYNELIDLHAKLELYGSRLKGFVRATISRAIEECDDTKLLKKLLALVS